MRVTAPFKVWLQRFAFVLMVMAAFGLVLIGRKETQFVENLRTSVTDALLPVLTAITAPVETVSDAFGSIGNIGHMQAEIDRLKTENQRLLRWEAVARRLEAENKAFRSMLNFVPEQPFRYISARVIADSSGAFVRSMLLDAGAANGIQKGQAVISGEGLVGRVSEVGERTARIILVTDLNSRIPVRLESSRDRGILAGDNTDQPRLIFLPRTARVIPGDRIVTSGDGGVFPPGLQVGTISVVDNGDIRVQPFVDWSRFEFLRVIDLQPTGVVGARQSGGGG